MAAATHVSVRNYYKAFRRVLFNRDLHRRMATMPTGRAADPAVHAVDPEEVEAVDAIKEHGLNPKDDDSETDYQPSNIAGGSVPLSPAKPPLPSSPKLESVGVNTAPSNPTTQQKRRFQAEKAICASPPSLDERELEERRRQRKEQEEDDKKYFENRKASPLSEIEFADTRKPISQASDHGTAYDGSSGEGAAVKMFSEEEEQVDSLTRAAEMWKLARERGDPDSPHGRILRELRGEYW